MKGFGSLPWLCGVWWLGLAIASHALAKGILHLGSWTFSLVWHLIVFSDWCSAEGMKCANEAGMYDPEMKDPDA